MSVLERKTVLPALGRATVSNPKSVQRLLDDSYTTLQVLTGRLGSQLDRAVTVRDLFEAGAIRLVDGQGFLNNNASNNTGFEPIPYVPPASDLTTPPAPTGLSVTGAITTNLLTWTAAGYGNHAYTEIWRNNTDNQGTAVMIGTTRASRYSDSVGYNSATWYYWIRFVSTAPVTGPFNATAGTSGTTQSSGGGTDTTAPGAITNLAASGGVKSIILTWTLPSDNDINVVEIHRHTANDRNAGGSIINKVKGTIYTDPVDTGSSYYYWVRAIDDSGNVGNWNAGATSGVNGTTGTVSSSDLADGSVIAAKLAAASVSTAALQDSAVSTAKLAALAVDAAALANSAVTSTKIANAAVGSAAIANAAIGTAHIQNAAIQTALIGDLQVTTAKIVDLGITNAKIADATILGAKIANATIDNAKISDLSASKLTAGTITSGVVNIGDTKFQLDGTGTNRHLLVQDNQGSPVTRVKIGKLGAGASDYGIQIFDASGNPVIDVAGTVYGAKIDQLAASKVAAGKLSGHDIVGAWFSTVEYDYLASSPQYTNGAYRVEIEDGSPFPFWYGNGTKGSASGLFYIDASAPTSRRVVIDGKVIAREGQIANFTISGNQLQAGSGLTTVRIDSSGDTAPLISAGDENPSIAPFRLYQDGSLVATKANISGTVTIGVGSTGFANLNDTPAGRGANIAHPKYSNFEESALPTGVVATNGTASIVSGGYFGTRALQLVATSGDNYLYCGASSSDYNIPLSPNKKWLISAYVSSPQASASGELFLRTSAAGNHYNIAFNTSGTPNTFTRVYGIIDLTSDASVAAIIRVDNNTASNTMKFDGIMLEEVWGAGTTPSAYSEPGVTIGALNGGGVLYLSSGSGKRITLNEANSNEARFYGDRGDGAIDQLASIGISPYGGDFIVGLFGTTQSSRVGVYGLSGSSTAVAGYSVSGTGVQAYSTNSFALTATGEQLSAISAQNNGPSWPAASIRNLGGRALDVNGTTYGIRVLGTPSAAPLYLVPHASNNAPTQSADKGSLWVASNGALWGNTGGGTTWKRVADQSPRSAGTISQLVSASGNSDFFIEHGLGTDDVVVDMVAGSSSNGGYFVMAIRPDLQMNTIGYQATNTGSLGAVPSGFVLFRLFNSVGQQTINVSYVIRPRNP